MENPIIVALDGKSYDESVEIATLLRGHVWGFKVNDLLLDSGIAVIQELQEHGCVMADPKLHDIPNTIKNGGTRLVEGIAPDIITVHASGGYKMLEEAVHVLPTQIAAVTVLTSLNEEDCAEIYNSPLAVAVTRLACVAARARVSYIVCSAADLALTVFQERMAEFTGNAALIPKICPGIRPRWWQDQQHKQDDQNPVRTMTPVEAIQAGAKYIVIGRPILNAPDPVEAAQRTLEEIAKG